jgi:hypothetical protein
MTTATKTKNEPTELEISEVSKRLTEHIGSECERLVSNVLANRAPDPSPPKVTGTRKIFRGNYV